MALQYKRQQVSMGQTKKFTGPSGATFQAKLVRETKCGPHDAVVVEISGKANYLGRSSFKTESDDNITP